MLVKLLLLFVPFLFSSVVYATDGGDAPQSPAGCGPSYWNPERDRWECVIIPTPRPRVVIPAQPLYVPPPVVYYDPVPAIVGGAIIGGILHHQFHHRHSRPPTIYRHDDYGRFRGHHHRPPTIYRHDHYQHQHRHR